MDGWGFHASSSIMFDESSKLTGIGDPLTAMLRGLRLEGVDYGRLCMAAPWGLALPPRPSAWFHFVGAGSCFLRVPAGEWIELREGDAVLLVRGAEHVLASTPEVRPEPLARFEIRPLCRGLFDVSCDGSGAPTVLFSGVMRFSLDTLHPLLAMMPDVMRLHELACREPSVPPLLEAMASEIALDRVGAGGMLARLADVLAATMVRAWVERGCGDATGWIAAVRDPRIGKVLAAIHLDPSGDWSVPRLARMMGVSRSGFAQRFAEVVGETPARYVTRVRMQEASRSLAEDREGIAHVARRLGYDSEASFSRAFKRILGVAPSRYRAGHASRA